VEILQARVSEFLSSLCWRRVLCDRNLAGRVPSEADQRGAQAQGRHQHAGGKYRDSYSGRGSSIEGAHDALLSQLACCYWVAEAFSSSSPVKTRFQRQTGHSVQNISALL
jgi:hypothetical protein